MTTKSKAAKKAKPKPTKPAAKPKQSMETLYTMPTEVSEWIERANSTIQHLRTQVATLKEENINLKAYRKFAEHRILRSEAE